MLTVREERWIIRRMFNNRRLSPRNLVAELEQHLHKKVCAETVRRVLRKHNLHDGPHYVSRKSGEELLERNLRSSAKGDGGSVMVWGCMAASGVGKLHFIEGIMKKRNYVQILKVNFKANATKLNIQNNFIFHHDNDPKHSSYMVREWCLCNFPRVLKTPPQSPDLIVIENLWAKLDREIRKVPFRTK
ncbi:hypothetical protein ANN_12987 [Periplaneta americana]|uniref:Transposase Tc1-like domain-containing protein n=1 Tax=Periplaneta americana TaxID=6978 RepID=A0ABQ8TIM0_PERAM|nr:hypothetical protein ANN_12987 [Periplaneta americana]